MTTKYIYFILLFCFHFHVNGQQNNLKQFHAIKVVDVVPAIDGKLDDPVWKAGEWGTDFVQYEPFNGRQPSYPTYFKILFDDNNLYVAMRAIDPYPDSIITRLTRRDNDEGDVMIIAFDSYYDKRTAFCFGVSAGGVKTDFILTNDGDNNNSNWDPNWWVKVAKNQEGWDAEMRIPLSQLRFKKGGSKVWGLQLLRKIYRNQETHFWYHVPKDAPGFVRHSGQLLGLEGLEPRKILDVTPYTVGSVSTYPAETSNPFAEGTDYHAKAGLDAKIGLTNNFTMDLSILPDFGQVEADPSEVNLSAYETYFEEKRPFFIEGNNISSFNLGLGDGGLGNDNLFYSRRIGRHPRGQFSNPENAYVDYPDFTRILGSVKITGKTEDGLSMALIETVTAEEKAQLDQSGQRTSETVEPQTNFFVGRIQKEMNEGNTIFGGMFTSVNRKLTDQLSDQMVKGAYSGGIDFTQYFKNKAWQLNINTAFSHLEGSSGSIARAQYSSARYFQRPDATHVKVDTSRTTFTGHGGKIQLGRYNSGHWSFLGAILWKSPEFEINDIGYMREGDQIMSVLWAGYRQWEPKRFYKNYQINLNSYNGWNFENLLKFVGMSFDIHAQFKNSWEGNTGFELLPYINSTDLLRGGPAMLLPANASCWARIYTDGTKKLVAGMNNIISYSFANNYFSYSITPSVKYTPFNNLNLTFSPSWSITNNAMQYVSESIFEEKSRYIMAKIEQEVINFSFRINYTISPDLTVQYWGQPFIATGHYSDFKFIKNPTADHFEDRIHVFETDQIKQEDDFWMIDENRDGITDYNIGSPNFHVREFLSNLVVRWEFNPGSAIYLVWSQHRTGFLPDKSIQVFQDMNELFSEKGTNTFLVKFSYRFGMK